MAPREAPSLRVLVVLEGSARCLAIQTSSPDCRLACTLPGTERLGYGTARVAAFARAPRSCGSTGALEASAANQYFEGVVTEERILGFLSRAINCHLDR
jgi:hypothetical protein